MKFAYKILGWSKRRDISLSSCCFSIQLDARFAEKARNLRFEKQDIFNKRICEIVEYKYARAIFWNDTAFLRSMSVKGNCACLGMSGSLLDSDWSDRDVITYSGHNVDSKEQAFDLLTIFTYWVDIVEALTYREIQKISGGGK